MKRLLSDLEIEQEYGILAVTLRGWRLRKKGPAWVKLHGSVRYERDAVDAWIAAARRSGGST